MIHQPHFNARVVLLAVLGCFTCSVFSAAEAQTVRRAAVETVIYAFTGGSDGGNPSSNLLVDASGALYGTTTSGGNTDCINGHTACGVVFRLSPLGSTYVEQVLYRFRGGADGATPVQGLIRDKAGSLYGTTFYGGNSSCFGGCGTVYKLTPQGSGYHETVLYRFGGGNDGKYAGAALIADRTGALYGTPVQGGDVACEAAGCGTVFELEPRGSTYTESILYRFHGGLDGMYPGTSLIIEKDALAGTTDAGGGSNAACSSGCGTVFRLRGTKRQKAARSGGPQRLREPCGA